MKKRSFTLIELAVALPLMGLLFSFLLISYTRSIKNNTQLDLKEQQALKEHYFQRRLEKKLWLATKQEDFPKKFFQKDAFSFYFYNGISLDPNAKGKLLAKLFLEDKTLKLSLFKRNDQTFVRTEELLKGIDNLQISYLYESKNRNRENLEKLIEDPKETKGLKFIAINVFLTKGNSTKKYFFHMQRGAS